MLAVREQERSAPLWEKLLLLILFSLYVALESGPFVALKGEKWTSSDIQMEN